MDYTQVFVFISHELLRVECTHLKDVRRLQLPRALGSTPLRITLHLDSGSQIFVLFLSTVLAAVKTCFRNKLPNPELDI